MKLLRFVNWDQTQHYNRKKRGAGPWTKLYNQLSSPAYTQLTDAERGQILSLQMLCGQMANNTDWPDGCLPFNAEWLQRAIFSTSALDLDRFIEFGFIETVELKEDGSIEKINDSNVTLSMLATCLHKERRGEENRGEQKRGDLVTEDGNRPAATRKRTKRRFVYPEAFEVFWAQSSQRGNKKPAFVAWDQLPDEDQELALEAMAADNEVWSSYGEYDRQYIPHVSTWLNQRSWEGERARRRNGKSEIHTKSHPHAEIGDHGYNPLAECLKCGGDTEHERSGASWRCTVCGAER